MEDIGYRQADNLKSWLAEAVLYLYVPLFHASTATSIPYKIRRNASKHCISLMNYGHKDASMNHHVQLDGILIFREIADM